jgi:hypothetical protein
METRARRAISVRKFWVSGMSPVAADLASAASAAAPGSAAAALPADGAELEALLLLELLPHALVTSAPATSRDAAVLLSMRRRLAHST